MLILRFDGIKVIGGMEMNQDPFKEYLIQTEPGKREKGYAWYTAIGLQAVDGLETSQYLVDTALQNIEGNISFAQAQQLLDTYYEQAPKREGLERMEEADKVSLKIAQLLSEKAFSFTPTEYISIHKKLFSDIYEYAGNIRKYNITKKEWVLNGDTILYGSASELRATLDYDFKQEKNFSYRGLSMDEIIHHLAKFISGLWQIHIFPEGNTRTTAVFFIKYLRVLGFNVTNDIFAENAWYFRNALVRANYNNLEKGIFETTEFLERFLRNLLCQEENSLHNRDMHVDQRIKDYKKVNIETSEVNIALPKVNIETSKLNIDGFSMKNKQYIQIMFDAFGTNTVFGRSDVQAIISLGNTRISALLKELAIVNLIESVSGQGKGKYKFCDNKLDIIE